MIYTAEQVEQFGNFCKVTCISFNSFGEWQNSFYAFLQDDHLQTMV